MAHPITTYRQLSQEIIDAHYNGMSLPEAGITQRFVAERIAMLVAKAAVRSAIGNSNLTEATYANDQFISVYNSIPLLTDSITAEKYIVMPATPAGLPHGREIAQVSFTNSGGYWCIPMQNKDDFIESGLPPLPQEYILFKVENGNIVFKNLPKIINSPVNLKLVGAIAKGTTLLDSFLNLPKDLEDDIFTTILNELATDYRIAPVTVNTAEPS